MATNIWGATLAEQIGLAIPMLAAQHQYVITRPLPLLKAETVDVRMANLRYDDEIKSVFATADHPDAEAILQLGTALPVVDLVAELEGKFEKPIVACNAVLYWQALRESGINDPLQGFGHL